MVIKWIYPKCAISWCITNRDIKWAISGYEILVISPSTTRRPSLREQRSHVWQEASLERWPEVDTSYRWLWFRNVWIHMQANGCWPNNSLIRPTAASFWVSLQPARVDGLCYDSTRFITWIWSIIYWFRDDLRRCGPWRQRCIAVLLGALYVLPSSQVLQLPPRCIR